VSTHELSRTRRRTHAALVAAARELVTEGRTPTVEEAAARADVSRTTAYRYFANQAELLVAAHPEVATTSLLDEDAPDDPVVRLELVLDRYLEGLFGSEDQQRTMLRLSLDPTISDERRAALPLRQGRVIGWVEQALEPLGDTWSAAERRRLAIAIRAAGGIESLVWLVDVAGYSRDEARAQMRWSAMALLAEALRSGPPGAPPDKVRR
jgi:AcrR family transcriptional regulator